MGAFQHTPGLEARGMKGGSEAVGGGSETFPGNDKNLEFHFKYYC
jgi:hypothetical protein